MKTDRAKHPAEIHDTVTHLADIQVFWDDDRSGHVHGCWVYRIEEREVDRQAHGNVIVEHDGDVYVNVSDVARFREWSGDDLHRLFRGLLLSKTEEVHASDLDAAIDESCRMLGIDLSQDQFARDGDWAVVCVVITRDLHDAEILSATPR